MSQNRERAPKPDQHADPSVDPSVGPSVGPRVGQASSSAADARLKRRAARPSKAGAAPSHSGADEASAGSAPSDGPAEGGHTGERRASPRTPHRPNDARPQRAKSASKRPEGKRPEEKGPARKRPARVQAAPSGYAARAVAVHAFQSITGTGIHLDEAFDHAVALPTPDGAAALSAADRAFARAILMTALRRHGQVAALLANQLEKGWPSRCGGLRAILQCAVAQIIFMEAPAHAVINIAVAQAQADRRARTYSGLANAVLRRIADAHAAGRLEPLPAPEQNLTKWLAGRWRKAYGAGGVKRIAEVAVRPPALDLTVARDAPLWAERLDAVVTSGKSLRLSGPASVEALPGYTEGCWWVQDVAATLPARLLAPGSGMRIADLCAAPGGKTAQLLAAGATVTSVDSSPRRLARLRENLSRLALTGDIVEAEVVAWSGDHPSAFDAVLLDAPCTATGTLRRHPDVLFSKTADQLASLCELQARLLDAASATVRPGGRLVYCTCSLEPEEGEEQIAAFLARNSDWRLLPVTLAELPGHDESVTAQGHLRTLPHHAIRATVQPGSDADGDDDGGAIATGMDGFFAARLERAQQSA